MNTALRESVSWVGSVDWNANLDACRAAGRAMAGRAARMAKEQDAQT